MIRLFNSDRFSVFAKIEPFKKYTGEPAKFIFNPMYFPVVECETPIKCDKHYGHWPIKIAFWSDENGFKLVDRLDTEMPSGYVCAGSLILPPIEREEPADTEKRFINAISSYEEIMHSEKYTILCKNNIDDSIIEKYHIPYDTVYDEVHALTAKETMSCVKP